MLKVPTLKNLDPPVITIRECFSGNVRIVQASNKKYATVSDSTRHVLYEKKSYIVDIDTKKSGNNTIVTIKFIKIVRYDPLTKQPIFEEDNTIEVAMLPVHVLNKVLYLWLGRELQEEIIHIPYVRYKDICLYPKLIDRRIFPEDIFDFLCEKLNYDVTCIIVDMYTHMIPDSSYTYDTKLQPGVYNTNTIINLIHRDEFEMGRVHEHHPRVVYPITCKIELAATRKWLISKLSKLKKLNPYYNLYK